MKIRKYTLSILFIAMLAMVSLPGRLAFSDSLDKQVGGDNDDAEERSYGDMDLDSDDLDLGEKIVGIRFTDINIPRGSQITNAYLKFRASDERSESTSLTIYGQYIGNAPAFSSDDEDISDRDRTGDSVPWSPGHWYSWLHVSYYPYYTIPWYQTPDLKDIVQAIINHPDWAEGNSMVFIITGSGHRTADSNDLHNAYEPYLHIEYEPEVAAIIELDTTELEPWVWEGGTADPASFTLRNTGTGDLNYTITDVNSGVTDWITCAPVSGGPVTQEDGPQTITISYDTSSLAAGHYDATITVSDPNASNNPQTIDIDLDVIENKADMEVDNTYVGVTGYQGSDAFAESFTLSNTGRAVLNYDISDNVDWLSCSSVGGSLAVDGSATININFNSDSLSAGIYEATITLHDANAITQYVNITVSLTVEPIPLSSACGEVPVYTENLVSPAILLLLDCSGSMAWNVSVSGQSYQSPDIKDIVQEIVDRGHGGNPGNWQAGNDMAFVITGSGKRTAYPYDSSHTEAPLLHVEYEGGDDVDIRVNSNSDDAEEDGDDDVTTDSSDLDLGESAYTGVCFRNVQIPQGATITSAYIAFSAYDTRTTATSLTIRGHDTDDASGFVAGNNNSNISNRTLTTASVAWNSIESWTGPTQQPRMEVAQDALNELVEDMTISWGFGTWEGNFPSGNDYTKINVGCRYNNPTHLANLQAAINAADPGGNTPLTPALNAGLDYFRGLRADLEYDETFIGADCQPTFVIVITDGQGNTGTTTANVGTTTADLATHGVNTVGIGFGLAQEDTEQLYKLAEVSNDKGDDSDDDSLYSLHEEVDGVPQPFLAQSKEDLVTALRSITSGIKAEVFYGSAPAPTTSVDYGDIVITAKFQPADWSGDLVSTQYNLQTGEVEDVLWEASEEMPETINAFTVLSGTSEAVPYTDATLATDSYICADKKLGDIINSTPIIVEDPPYTYDFDDYLEDFKYATERDPLVYIGANDGALHAFLLADKVESGVTTYGGTEIWRFYPTAVHDNLNKAGTEDNWDMCDESTYCHRYYVDGSPVVADVYDGSEWKTMLVCGLREGGEAYFALDITSGKPFDDATDPSEFLWEFTDSELGQTWADPAIDRVSLSGGGTAWGVFFGSGYEELQTDQSSKEAYLYAVEADNMDDFWIESGTTTTNRIKISSTTLEDDALSSPLVADLEGDFIGDFIYVGNLYGSMYRVKNIGKGMEPVVTTFFDSQNTSDHGNSIRAKADFAYGEDSGEIWVYFGSGKYEGQVDKYSSAQQYFFGLKDISSGTTTYTIDDLVDLSAGYLVDDTTGDTLRVISGSNPSNDPWYIGLDNTSEGLIGSERVISQPLAAGGIVFFTTFIPDEDVCAGSGDAWLFAVDYETGLAPSNPVFDINADGVINEEDVIHSGDDTYNVAAISIGSGQPSKPVLHKDTIFVTTTGGGLIPVKVDLPGTLANMTSWKEDWEAD